MNAHYVLCLLTQYGEAPLLIAKHNGYERIVELLLEASRRR